MITTEKSPRDCQMYARAYKVKKEALRAKIKKIGDPRIKNISQAIIQSVFEKYAIKLDLP